MAAPSIRRGQYAPASGLTSAQEARSLQFFVERTIKQLTNFFPDDLWGKQVLQVAQSEASIRHALVSFSAYHEAFTTSGSRDEVPFALRHYNASIQQVCQSRPDLSWTYIQLLSCSIFICIEVRRGSAALLEPSH